MAGTPFDGPSVPVTGNGEPAGSMPGDGDAVPGHAGRDGPLRKTWHMPKGPPVSVISTLVVLTLVSGLVDAVCYLGLGRVFTANMTGNVVVLGFAAAGAPGFSVPATLTSLAVFLVGAACASGMSRRIPASKRAQMLLTAMATEAVFVGAGAAVAFSVPAVGHGWPRYVVIALLAFAMGVRNATIRRLAVPDLTTTVLTMTLTGLAADSPLVGGDNRAAVRRTAAVAAMLAGAVGGAALYLHRGAGLPLLVAALAVVAAGVAFSQTRGPAELDSPEPAPAADATMVHVNDAPQVTDNRAESRLELRADGGLAYLEYRLNGKRLVLIHTETPVELEGRGFGGRLVAAAVDRAKQENLTVVPLCPFARGWLERHGAEASDVPIDWGKPV
jgi:uncharacterized membrane protein YoaK (UPF0700 family)/predicted GNAT family acetyltransferase